MAQPISDFGKFLEGLRGSMSLREAAKKSGLSHAYIRDLELERNRSTNDRITPSPDTLKKLSAAYGYPYTELMIKAGHLMSDDVVPTVSHKSKIELDLSQVLYIEIGMKEITYHLANNTVARSIDSLVDFSHFQDSLEENEFKKMDTDLYVNFNQVRKYDEKKGRLYFDEPGIGVHVVVSAIRQRKYHDLLLRKVAINTNKSLEFSYGRQAGIATSLSSAEKNI